MKVKKLSSREKLKIKKISKFAIIISLVVSIIAFFMYRKVTYSIIGFFAAFILFYVYNYFKDMLVKSSRIKRFEDVFPDFLQLMASNLRAGMTIDRAILLSSRPEFAPLDQEILKTGKDIATGKSIESALLNLSDRIGSEKIDKTLILIISGIQSGGNISVLLEETSVNMRERNFVQQKAASSVMMYVIFIFLAVAIFAPALFSLSTVLVEILNKILAGVPKIETNMNMPFTMTSINISVDFIKYFAIIFMISIDIFSSLVIGLVSKGDEKEGLKYLPIILFLSISIFFIARVLITRIMAGFM